MSENQSSNHTLDMKKYFCRASGHEFRKIPGSPIAYWAPESVKNVFSLFRPLHETSEPLRGVETGDNERFLKQWSEVNFSAIGVGCKAHSDKSFFKWFPYNKGGGFQKWYGMKSLVIDWENEGCNIKNQKFPPGSRLPWRAANNDKYFSDGITWGGLTSSVVSFRFSDYGAIFDSNKGAMMFPDACLAFPVLGFLNSKIAVTLLHVLNPTISTQNDDVGNLPLCVNLDHPARTKVDVTAKSCVALAQVDWNSYETSWDFTSLPLLHPDHRQPILKACYRSLRAHWREMTLDLQRLEEENNRIFIDAYGLQDELTPEVPLNEITLTCNPHYRYGGDKTEEELEALLLADTMRELVSYAVGCMFGRYSLDKPGLILANQGETLADYLAQVQQPRFPADDDNVIPLLDGDWFPDDITLRFRQFLRVAFGDAHYEDNLAFIEQALNVKGKRNYGLRDYFLGEFYADHVKRYKKRPIYWLFSSPKGSFNALIYMHRYRPDTVSVVLKYLRDYREKLATEKERQAAVSINPGSSQGEKTKALKEGDRLAKVLSELEDYERDTLYPLATEQVQIDLDDGVKVNYLKFGPALKKIAGLEAKDED